MRNQRLVRAAAGLVLLLTTPATGRTRLGRAVTSGSRHAVSSALIVASATEAIRVCSFDARNQLLFDSESRLKATNEGIDGLAAEARLLAKEKQQLHAGAVQEIRTRAPAGPRRPGAG